MDVFIKNRGFCLNHIQSINLSLAFAIKLLADYGCIYKEQRLLPQSYSVNLKLLNDYAYTYKEQSPSNFNYSDQAYLIGRVYPQGRLGFDCRRAHTAITWLETTDVEIKLPPAPPPRPPPSLLKINPSKLTTSLP